ncbi:MAG: hypothetical protein ACRD33_07315, partial [Candidatus Acidiferrales bacterium]
MTQRPAVHHNARVGRFWLSLIAAIVALTLFGALPARAQNDNDHTLQAMQDEMARNVARLRLPGQLKPFYIEYRV